MPPKDWACGPESIKRAEADAERQQVQQRGADRLRQAGDEIAAPATHQVFPHHEPTARWAGGTIRDSANGHQRGHRPPGCPGHQSIRLRPVNRRKTSSRVDRRTRVVVGRRSSACTRVSNSSPSSV